MKGIILEQVLGWFGGGFGWFGGDFVVFLGSFIKDHPYKESFKRSLLAAGSPCYAGQITVIACVLELCWNFEPFVLARTTTYRDGLKTHSRHVKGAHVGPKTLENIGI